MATIHGGARKNIIPDQVEMTGTIRSFDEDMRQDIHARIKHIAEANHAQAEVRIEKAVPNYSPRFFVDESGLLQGTRSLAALAVDFLEQKP